jgi:hypothetical protein
MKNLISLILCGLLIFSLVACEKSQDESTALEESITSMSTTEGTTAEIKQEFNLFAEDMAANFYDYKPCKYEDYKYTIKAEIPESWSYELCPGLDENFENSASSVCGLELYKNDTNIISVIRYKDSHSYLTEDYDNQENFITKTGLKGVIAYDIYSEDKKIQGFIQLENFPLILIHLNYMDVNYFEENKQEIFNVLNSINIVNKPIIFYDFKYSREDDLITNEDNFYDKNILSDLKSRFQEDIIDFAKRNFSKEFAENYGNQTINLTPEFYFGVTDDFNGDGKNESFVVISYKDLLYTFEPASILYLIDSTGNQSIVAIENYIDLGFITYPDEKQITYITSYGTGLSYSENIYSYDGDKVFLVNTVNTSGFEKDGPFLAAYPRVGCAGEVLPKFYYWVSEESKYNEVPYVIIPINNFISSDNNKKFCDSLEGKYSMKVSGVATLANKYYVIELTDNENNKSIRIFEYDGESYKKFEYATEIFPFELSYFTIEGDVEIDYGYAVASAIK